jgi:UDP-2-acetamido-2-deoxy-ribo-hexuluronate aminotransferase
MIKFFNPGLGYKKIKKEVDKEMQRVLESGDLILRKDVEEFEKKLAEFVGTKYAVGLNSGTDALYLALKSVGIGFGDKVMVPSRTFVATAQVVIQLGAIPVFYDYQDSIHITDDIRAIIPVHIEGEMEKDMALLVEFCRRNKIYVIEDACQALGATQKGKKAGSIGDAGAFSFYPAKILGCYGDGGALVTNDKSIYEYVKEARNHFKETNINWGINSRLDNLQATVLNIKIDMLPETLARREEIALRYNERLTDKVGKPPNTEGRVWQDYIIRTDKRDELYEFLKEKGIETMKNEYPFPVPKLPKAKKYESETLRLPCNELLTDKEVEEVIINVNKFYE